METLRFVAPTFLRYCCNVDCRRASNAGCVSCACTLYFAFSRMSSKRIFLGSGSIGFFHWIREEDTEHIRSIYVHIRAFFCIYGAYTGLFLHIRSIYGPFFAYTEHIRAFFCIYGAYTGLFFPYTEHIRGIFFHIRSIYGAFFFAYTEHIRSCFLHIRSIYGAHTCIYSTIFPDTGHIRGIYEHIRYVVEKFGKIYFGWLRFVRNFVLLTDL